MPKKNRSTCFKELLGETVRIYVKGIPAALLTVEETGDSHKMQIPAFEGVIIDVDEYYIYITSGNAADGFSDMIPHEDIAAISRIDLETDVSELLGEELPPEEEMH